MRRLAPVVFQTGVTIRGVNMGEKLLHLKQTSFRLICASHFGEIRFFATGKRYVGVSRCKKRSSRWSWCVRLSAPP